MIANAMGGTLTLPLIITCTCTQQTRTIDDVVIDMNVDVECQQRVIMIQMLAYTVSPKDFVATVMCLCVCVWWWWLLRGDFFASRRSMKALYFDVNEKGKLVAISIYIIYSVIVTSYRITSLHYFSLFFCVTEMWSVLCCIYVWDSGLNAAATASCPYLFIIIWWISRFIYDMHDMICATGDGCSSLSSYIIFFFQFDICQLHRIRTERPVSLSLVSDERSQCWARGKAAIESIKRRNLISHKFDIFNTNKIKQKRVRQNA